MTVRIAQASLSDAADVCRIYSPYVFESPASFELEPPSTDEMASRIESSLAKHAWLVARDDDAVVGYAYGTTARSRAAYRFTVEVSVYLDQARRGQGMGTLLMNELLSVLKRRGYVTAIAGITLPNDGSVRLFERLGFEPVGVYKNIGFKFGRWHDVGWWQRLLADSPPLSPAEVPVDG